MASIWLSTLKKFFNADEEILRDVIIDIEKINNSFNRCDKSSVDAICIIQIHRWNQERSARTRARKERVARISEKISDSIKFCDKKSLYEAIELNKQLLREMKRDNAIETTSLQNIITGMTESKRKNLLKFKEKPKNFYSWDVDVRPSKIFYSDVVHKCSHQNCCWIPIWKKLSNEKIMPIEFCNEMTKTSIDVNSSEPVSNNGSSDFDSNSQ